MESRSREVVRVARRGFLIGPGAQTSGDSWSDGMAEEPVYYVALWLTYRRPKRRRARLRYFGPFQSRVQARFLALSALAMGLTESGSGGRRPVAVPEFDRRSCSVH